MTHALAARDYAFAASVMERKAAQLWLKGEAKTIATWVLMLPDAELRSHMSFALTSALHLLSSTQSLSEQQRAQALVQTTQIIARVEQALQDERGVSLSPTEEKRFQNRICLLRGCMEMWEKPTVQDRLTHLHTELPMKRLVALLLKFKRKQEIRCTPATSARIHHKVVLTFCKLWFFFSHHFSCNISISRTLFPCKRHTFLGNVHKGKGTMTLRRSPFMPIIA